MYRSACVCLGAMALVASSAWAQQPAMPVNQQIQQRLEQYQTLTTTPADEQAKVKQKSTNKHPFSAKKAMKITDESPLIKAIISGQESAVRPLLKSKAVLNAPTKDGSTPLIVATLKSTPRVMQLLTANGADVAQQDQFGRAAIHYAAMIGDADKIKLLASLDPLNDRPDQQGITPLYYAYLNDQTEAAGVLINDFDAKINQMDLTGNPLAFLVVKYHNNPAVIDHMIAQKLNLFKRNSTNQSLLDVAKKEKNKAVAERLKAASDEQLKGFLEQQTTPPQKTIAP